MKVVVSVGSVGQRPRPWAKGGVGYEEAGKRTQSYPWKKSEYKRKIKMVVIEGDVRVKKSLVCLRLFGLGWKKCMEGNGYRMSS